MGGQIVKQRRQATHARTPPQKTRHPDVLRPCSTGLRDLAGNGVGDSPLSRHPHIAHDSKDLHVFPSAPLRSLQSTLSNHREYRRSESKFLRDRQSATTMEVDHAYVMGQTEKRAEDDG